MEQLQTQVSEVIRSPLPRTWFLDFDGTLVKHNNSHPEKEDELLPGVREFFAALPKEDVVVITTARSITQESNIKEFMRLNEMQCQMVLCGLPTGKRILVNDTKPSGYVTAFAVPVTRDSGFSAGVFEFLTNSQSSP